MGTGWITLASLAIRGALSLPWTPEKQLPGFESAENLPDWCRGAIAGVTEAIGIGGAIKEGCSVLEGCLFWDSAMGRTTEPS